MKIAVATPELVDDAVEVAETARRVGLFTPKRLVIAAGVAFAVTGTVLLVKRIRARKAEVELEA
jgi:hypothetical protein